MHRLITITAMAIATLLPATATAHTTRPGPVVFGTGISLISPTVTGKSTSFRPTDTIAYAATLSRPAHAPWLLLSFSRVYPGRGSQLIERDWIDADEGDTSFVDWIPTHVLRPGGTYAISIREHGRTLADGSFHINSATAEDIGPCSACRSIRPAAHTLAHSPQ